MALKHLGRSLGSKSILWGGRWGQLMALFRSAACFKQNPLSVWNRTQARNSAIRQLALGCSSRRSPVSCQRGTL